MSSQLSNEEKHKLEERLFELKQEHRDLDDVINRLLLTPDVEELHFPIDLPTLPIWLVTHQSLRHSPRVSAVWEALETGVKPYFS